MIDTPVCGAFKLQFPCQPVRVAAGPGSTPSGRKTLDSAVVILSMGPESFVEIGSDARLSALHAKHSELRSQHIRAIGYDRNPPKPWRLNGLGLQLGFRKTLHSRAGVSRDEVRTPL